MLHHMWKNNYLLNLETGFATLDLNGHHDYYVAVK